LNILKFAYYPFHHQNITIIYVALMKIRIRYGKRFIAANFPPQNQRFDACTLFFG
jgi:arabinogalactan endo-1,4-beta-galactosidase